MPITWHNKFFGQTFTLIRFHTRSRQQEATWLIGEQHHESLQVIIQLISHPQCEAIPVYKPQLVGEHRLGNVVIHSQATHFTENFIEKLFTLEAVACEHTIQATVSDNPHSLLPRTWVFMRSRQNFCNFL